MTSDVILREVRDGDLAVFFEQQSDPVANRMAAFIARDPTDRDAFAAHWTTIRADETVTVKTIVFEGHVAGNVGCFEHLGKPEVCYWIGKAYWGQGIATAGLSQFLTDITRRPLYASIAGDNLASIRVLEKCGFATVERKRSFAKARGEEIEEIVMRLA
ncbi:MAG: GNAT family N-acetyltransferase [Phycisphaerae bacterium]